MLPPPQRLSDPATAAVREDLVVRWGVEDDLANLVEIDLPGFIDAVCLVVDQAVAINGSQLEHQPVGWFDRDRGHRHAGAVNPRPAGDHGSGQHPVTNAGGLPGEFRDRIASVIDDEVDACPVTRAPGAWPAVKPALILRGGW